MLVEEDVIRLCSQSPIFSWDCLDKRRLTVTAILWQPVTQNARSRWSYGKIEECEQSKGVIFFQFQNTQKLDV